MVERTLKREKAFRTDFNILKHRGIEADKTESVLNQLMQNSVLTPALVIDEHIDRKILERDKEVTLSKYETEQAREIAENDIQTEREIIEIKTLAEDYVNSARTYATEVDSLIMSAKEFTLEIYQQTASIENQKIQLSIKKFGNELLDVENKKKHELFTQQFIGLDIEKTELDIERTELQQFLTEVATEEEQLKIDRKDIEKMSIEYDIANEGLRRRSIELDIAKVDIQKLMADVDIKEAQVKSAEMDITVAMVDYEIAKIEAEKAKIKADIKELLLINAKYNIKEMEIANEELYYIPWLKEHVERLYGRETATIETNDGIKFVMLREERDEKRDRIPPRLKEIQLYEKKAQDVRVQEIQEDRDILKYEKDTVWEGQYYDRLEQLIEEKDVVQKALLNEQTESELVQYREKLINSIISTTAQNIASMYDIQTSTSISMSLTHEIKEGEGEQPDATPDFSDLPDVSIDVETARKNAEEKIGL